MYLKDVVVFEQTRFRLLEESYPFGFSHGVWIELIDSVGDVVDTKHSAFYSYKGTPISDRDYRLAIARALSQKANQTS